MRCRARALALNTPTVLLVATALLASSATRVAPAASLYKLIEVGAGEPVLFIEKQSTLVVEDGLVSLLNDAQPVGHLLNDDVVDVEQGLNRYHHLSQVLGHELLHIPHYLVVDDIIAEET